MRLCFLPATFAVLFACSMGPAAARDIQPKILPGYTPEDADTEMGIWMELKDYEKAIQRSALLIKDKQLNEYVQTAACRVAGDYCNDLRIYVIRNPNFNASMTANGVMEVWTGLVVRVSSEDELAAVLGHELAHYTQLHSLAQLRRIRKSMTAGSVFDLGVMILSGVSVPAGQMAAMASLMSFSVAQEEEADMLGVQFMARAGYDPHAAAKVWEMIVAEHASAAVKRREPGIFSRTHPHSADRIDALNTLVNENYAEIISDPAGQKRHVEMLNRYYVLLMEDQLDTNRFGRTQAILRKHEKIGVDRNLINFFRGEMYRQRNGEGDAMLAKKAYTRAVQGEKPVADAHLNLGYMFLKSKDLSQAKYHFKQYLELEPDADDRAMIEFYLKDKRQ